MRGTLLVRGLPSLGPLRLASPIPAGNVSNAPLKKCSGLSDPFIVKLLRATLLATAPLLLGQPSRFGLPACQGPASELADREILRPLPRLLAPRPHLDRLRNPPCPPRRKCPSSEPLPLRPGALRACRTRRRLQAQRVQPRSPGPRRRHGFLRCGHPRQLRAFELRSSACVREAVHVLTGPIFSRGSIEFAGDVAVSTSFLQGVAGNR